MADLIRWRSTWSGLGVTAPDEGLYHELIRRYTEPHRRYHTAQHLDECFARLDEARDLARHIHEVELALWFHDAVYGTRGSDNEEQSAEWAGSQWSRLAYREQWEREFTPSFSRRSTMRNQRPRTRRC